MSDPVPPAAVPRPVDAALAKLEPALSEVADVLATLSPTEWRALMREEWGVVFAQHQALGALGWPEGEMIPVQVVGNRAFEIFAAKYPDRARDDRAA
jgi:hypothetical protein